VDLAMRAVFVASFLRRAPPPGVAAVDLRAAVSLTPKKSYLF
jgi:hypothetical protein